MPTSSIVFHSILSGSELHVPGFKQPTDPGAVGSGMEWIDTGTGSLFILKSRNSGNTDWDLLTPVSVSHAINADTASLATTASFATTSSFTTGVSTTGSYTGSFTGGFVGTDPNSRFTGSFTGAFQGIGSGITGIVSATHAVQADTATFNVSSSHALRADTASFADMAGAIDFIPATASFAVTASYALRAGVALSGTGSFTGSFGGSVTASLNATGTFSGSLDVPRNDVILSTNIISSGSSEVGTVALGSNYMLHHVTTNHDSRIRLYRSGTYRDADLARPAGTDPQAGSESGLVLDLLVTGSFLSWDLSPVVWGSTVVDGDDTPYTIDNLTTGSFAFVVTITRTRLQR